MKNQVNNQVNETAYLITMLKNLYTVPAFKDLDDCFQQGEAAGDQAYCRDVNPYSIGTSRHEWWDAGWSHSYDQSTGGR